MSTCPKVECSTRENSFPTRQRLHFWPLNFFLAFLMCTTRISWPPVLPELGNEASMVLQTLVAAIMLFCGHGMALRKARYVLSSSGFYLSFSSLMVQGFQIRNSFSRFRGNGESWFNVGRNWVYVLVKLVVTLSTSDYRSIYAAVGDIVNILQVIAFLEVLHAGLGLVRSDPITALMQWAGRAHVLVAVIGNLPQVQRNISVFITLAAWDTTEIVRYAWYALSGIGQCPKWLTYLRYTMFIVLYPAGVSGEMMALYAALGPIRDGELSFKIFDSVPISYYSFIIGLLILYPLLFLVLYRHMFKQRQARFARKEGGATRLDKDK